MCGSDSQQAGMWSYLAPEERGPVSHMVWPIRHDVERELIALLPPKREKLYVRTGRPSIAPEKLLCALLLQVRYRLRNERHLMEDLRDHLLFRWCVGLDRDTPMWGVTIFTKNRDRLLAGEVATAFFEQGLAQAKAHRLLCDEHFTVDGTLIEAWAGQKSFKPKTDVAPVPPPDDPGNPSVDFRGERRTNVTHTSTTDPEARLYKKAAGQEAKGCFMGHGLMENRHGLVVNTRLTPATGTAEREAAAPCRMPDPPPDGSRWEARRTTTPPRSWTRGGFDGDAPCGPAHDPADEGRRGPMMAGLRGTSAMLAANRSASGSKRSSAG
ncbi:MAG: transposase [Nitrospira defluvii]|nr:transposase [Nitrospira defluvii]